MAKETEIIYNVKVETSDSVKNIDKLDESMKDLNKTTGEQAKTVDNLDKSLEKTTKTTKKTGGGIGKLAGGFKKLTASLGIIGLLTTLWGVLSKNQKIMDAVNVVMGTISIVFNSVGTAVGNALDKFSGLGLSMESTKKTMSDLFTVALNPLIIWFQNMKSGVLKAQLIWEKSFLGGNDENKIAELNQGLQDIETEITALSKESDVSGANISKTFDKIKTVVSEAATEIGNSISTSAIKTANANADALVQMRKNLQFLEIDAATAQLKAQEKAELARQERDDITKTTEERQAANDKLGIILEEQLKKEKDLLQKKINIAQAEVDADKDNTEKQLALYQLKNEATAEIEERITSQKSEQLSNRAAINKEAADKEAADLKTAADDHKKAVENNAKILTDIYRQTEQGKLEIKNNADEDAVKNSTLSKEKKAAALLEIEKNYQTDLKVITDEAKAVKDAEDEEEKAKKEAARIAELEAVQENLDKAQDVNNNLANANNIILDNRLMKVDKAFNKEKKILDKKLKDGLISQTTYDKQLIDLEDKKLKEENAAKKKAFEVNKALSLAQLAIDTAGSIVATWKQYGSIPAPVGPILAGVQTAAIVGLAAVQASTISGTQFQAAAGGGKLMGPSHAAASGGQMVNPNVLAEGGEIIINKASSEAYEGVLGSINSAGNSNRDSNNVSDIIDYQKMGEAVRGNITVSVNSHDITDQQEEDQALVTDSEF